MAQVTHVVLRCERVLRSGNFDLDGAHDRARLRRRDGHDTRAIQHYLGHRNIVHTVRYGARVGAVQRVLAGLAANDRSDPEGAELELDGVERQRADAHPAFVASEQRPPARLEHQHFERLP